MSATDWRIPPSVTRWLAETPADAPVAVLLRHSVRGSLPPGDAGNAVPQDWPWYLEGAFFRQAGDCISTAYRDRFKWLRPAVR
ncbi:MAG: hypothetical protein OXI15_16155 [Chromatiales bacterium]|nr:hypothetical protein [Chromatiales bacterium]